MIRPYVRQKDMKGIEHSKFKSESSLVAGMEKLVFPLSAEVTGKESVSAFRDIETIYKSLQETVSRYSKDTVELKLFSPTFPTKKFKQFEIVSEAVLKEKWKVSLDMMVEAKFISEPDFWSRGLAVSELVDMLEAFCDSQTREKGRFVALDRAFTPIEDDTIQANRIPGTD